MQVGGGSVNAVVRAALPSAGGHGVAPSTASPGRRRGDARAWTWWSWSSVVAVSPSRRRRRRCTVTATNTPTIATTAIRGDDQPASPAPLRLGRPRRLDAGPVPRLVSLTLVVVDHRVGAPSRAGGHRIHPVRVRAGQHRCTIRTRATTKGHDGGVEETHVGGSRHHRGGGRRVRPPRRAAPPGDPPGPGSLAGRRRGALGRQVELVGHRRVRARLPQPLAALA